MQLLTTLPPGQRSFDGPRRSLLVAGIASGALAACQTVPSPQSSNAFPPIGRSLLVTFSSFRTEMNFHSASSLTWFLLNPDGSKGRSETVAIRVQALADQVFMVTWQEANRTTVVSIEDFARKVAFTNVTRPDGTFLQSQGTFVEV